MDEARWIAGLLSKLSDKQISDAFRAANYTPGEVRTLTAAVKGRIDELASIPARGFGEMKERCGAPCHFADAVRRRAVTL